MSENPHWTLNVLNIPPRLRLCLRLRSVISFLYIHGHRSSSTNQLCQPSHHSQVTVRLKSDKSCLQLSEWWVGFYRRWEEMFTVRLRRLKTWRTPPTALANLVKRWSPLTVWWIPATEAFPALKHGNEITAQPRTAVVLLTELYMSRVIIPEWETSCLCLSGPLRQHWSLRGGASCERTHGSSALRLSMCLTAACRCLRPLDVKQFISTVKLDNRKQPNVTTQLKREQQLCGDGLFSWFFHRHYKTHFPHLSKCSYLLLPASAMHWEQIWEQFSLELLVFEEINHLWKNITV